MDPNLARACRDWPRLRLALGASSVCITVCFAEKPLRCEFNLWVYNRPSGDAYTVGDLLGSPSSRTPCGPAKISTAQEPASRVGIAGSGIASLRMTSGMRSIARPSNTSVVAFGSSAILAGTAERQRLDSRRKNISWIGNLRYCASRDDLNGLLQ
jgi:hypothetical protein